MIGLRLTFTAGRYHATGWDHHVNEGVAEWPPAPWRILRALVAASYRLDEPDRVATADLVERLTALPLFRLPPSSSAHLRHYMPTDDSSVKVLDTFIAVGKGAQAPADVLVWWPAVELTTPQRALLERLSEQIGYLGRAESWVEIAVIDSIDAQPNARPITLDEPTSSGESVRLLAAQSSDALADWRGRAATASTSGKKKSSIRLPESVWEALNVDTGVMQREGWSQAPGSCWVDYRVGERPRVRPQRQGATPRGPLGAVFLLESAVLPTIDQTLIVAERFRSSVMGRRDAGPAHWQFSGKDEHDQPLEGHGHAYFLPIAGPDPEREGRTLIDRVLVWARDGLEPEAWRHLQRRITGSKPWQLRGESDHPLHLILAGYGNLDELQALLEPDVFGPARVWVSATPFMPLRFVKHRRGEILDAPEDQLRRLCQDVLGHEVVSVDPYEPKSQSAFGWNRFVRYRKKDRERMAGRQGLGFRITFAQDVEGPVVLGYGAHFGLGQFRPKG